MGSREDINIPIYGINVKMEAIKPNKNGKFHNGGNQQG